MPPRKFRHLPLPAAIPVPVQTDLRAELQATLGDGFRVTRDLAGGGVSRVFVAEEALLQREVVVKLLPPDLMAGLSVERFRAEIQSAVRLQHPHIVPVLSAGVIEYAGGTRGPYYTMPYIRGETLRTRLEREGTLAAEDVRRILLDVVDALGHAHDHGIVHRDIKPDNIFIAGQSAVVTDFGVAKAVTGIGVALGTPGYMAPEQAAGEQGLDHRADIYAVGVLAYELLTGRRPFEGTSIQQLLIAQAVRTPVPLLELCPDTPPLLAAIVMRCLQKRPQDRYESAHELLAALEMLPSGSHSGAMPIVSRPAPRRSGRRAAGLAGLGLVVLTLLLWSLVDSLRRVAEIDGETDAASSDVLPAQELATWYAWIGNAAESLKYRPLAFSRSPVGVDQRIVQSGVYDRVRQAPGFQEELTRLQDAAWPRVMEQRQRLEESDRGMPLAARGAREGSHGG